jgi:hypothetical protein
MRWLMIMSMLALTSCYNSSGKGEPESMCSVTCGLMVECGGLDPDACMAGCEEASVGISPGCRGPWIDLMVCLHDAGCDGVALYESAAPEDDYPCRPEEERALDLGCIFP